MGWLLRAFKDLTLTRIPTLTLTLPYGCNPNPGTRDASVGVGSLMEETQVLNDRVEAGQVEQGSVVVEGTPTRPDSTTQE